MNPIILTIGIILLVVGGLAFFLKFVLWLAWVLLLLGIIGTLWGFIAKEMKTM